MTCAARRDIFWASLGHMDASRRSVVCLCFEQEKYDNDGWNSLRLSRWRATTPPICGLMDTDGLTDRLFIVFSLIL